MEKIIIRNLGPIKSVDFLLNKVNVFMGPQSSGKSTIAKVISYCQWVEKRYILDGEFDYKFSEQFIDFHKISEEYFSEDSFIQYESEYVIVTYNGQKQSLKKKSKSRNYRKSKNIYIPAERNFVSVIPNLRKFKETNDNIMSFLYDWFSVKEKYSKKNSLPVLNLPIKFHHNKTKDSDILTLSKVNKEIKLQNASSGLQSVIPLILLVDYLTENFYNEKPANSISEKNQIKRIISNNISDIFENMDRLREFQESSDEDIEEKLNSNEFKKLLSLLVSRSLYHHSQIIIEEPEQNLFPESQKDLIYFILQKITNTDRDHKVIITTHSPYILYAINNCVLGGNLERNIPKEVSKELESSNSWIKSNSVSIWEIQNGELKSIKDETTGTVSKHYFNRVMNDVMDEYYEMLNYLEL